MAPLKYPIGIQTFEDIRTEGYLYVDKTQYIHKLLTGGSKQVFLSRPRRFGKSLLISTLKAYFEGRKELFEGLALGELETEWESYPVLRFSFGSMAADDAEKVQRYVHNRLREYEEKFSVKVNDEEPDFGDRFGMLIKNVAEKTGKRVVILVDEYDKGIVEILQNEEKLGRNISMFRPFYAQLKDQDQYIRFAFLTGVSRFRNLTLFSSPNQLQDISMDSDYAAICGLTSDELHTTFEKGIEKLAIRRKITVEEAKELLKLKYDGYRFTDEEVYVYNPFSILNSLNQSRLDNYWFTSGGTSKVFLDYLKNSEYDLSEIEKMWVSAETLGGPYSLKEPIPLLFQTGYLTIADYEDDMYRLRIPNGEVRISLIDQLAPLYLGTSSDDARMMVIKIGRLVKQGDAEGLMVQFREIMSKFAHQNFKLNNVEHIYHLIFALIFQMAGVNAQCEVSVAGGDIDMLVKTRKYLYVFEFKKDRTAEEALRQIDEKGYALPWKADGRKVFKIGVEFSSANRNITDWIVREV